MFFVVLSFSFQETFHEGSRNYENVLEKILWKNPMKSFLFFLKKKYSVAGISLWTFSKFLQSSSDVCFCMLKIIFSVLVLDEFRALLDQQASIEDFAEWISTLIMRCIVTVNFHSMLFFISSQGDIESQNFKQFTKFTNRTNKDSTAMPGVFELWSKLIIGNAYHDAYLYFWFCPNDTTQWGNSYKI